MTQTDLAILEARPDHRSTGEEFVTYLAGLEVARIVPTTDPLGRSL